jgi:predicted nucleic acid-binding Zn finger protein
MKPFKIEKLQTIKNYALERNVTTSYIYKLVKEGKMDCCTIDGVQFIQTDIYPSIPVANRRKL